MLASVFTNVIPSNWWTMDETPSSTLLWDGYLTHFSIAKLKLCPSIIWDEFVYKEIISNPILHSTGSNQRYNAAFSSCIFYQKGKCHFNWSYLHLQILTKVTVFTIAVTSDTHCCTTIWGVQVQTGCWRFVCSVPLIVLCCQPLFNTYTLFMMN